MPHLRNHLCSRKSTPIAYANFTSRMEFSETQLNLEKVCIKSKTKVTWFFTWFYLNQILICFNNTIQKDIKRNVQLIKLLQRFHPFSLIVMHKEISHERCRVRSHRYTFELSKNVLSTSEKKYPWSILKHLWLNFHQKWCCVCCALRPTVLQTQKPKDETNWFPPWK